MARILIVDDEDSVRAIMGQILSSKGHTPVSCRSVQEALDALAAESIDLVISDIRMEPTSGIVLLKQIRSIQPDTPVIMMTAYASVETALDALKIGAYDYLTKPFKITEFIDVVEKALASVGDRDRSGDGEGGAGAGAAAAAEQYCFGQVVGVSTAMLEACRLLELVAPTDATVLLHGESGTGRGLLARTIHEKSLRAGKECLSIECDKMGPEQRPAARETGGAAVDGEAPKDLVAALKEAAGGTVVLESVERLTAAGQKVLLSLLRDRSIPGKDQTQVPMDLRVIATAAPKLRKAVETAAFDEELYKRLGLLSVEIKPLSERRDDILPLFFHFLREESGTEGRLPDVSADVRGALQHYIWPGNVRELRQVVAYAWAHRINGAIARHSLPADVLSTLTVSEYVGAAPELDANRGAALKAFLRKKGVELTGTMLRKGGGDAKDV